jgi:hypothetical protein
MSQKSSLPKTAKSVSKVLTADSSLSRVWCPWVMSGRAEVIEGRKKDLRLNLRWFIIGD